MTMAFRLASLAAVLGAALATAGAAADLTPSARQAAQSIAPDAYLMFSSGTLTDLEASLENTLLNSHAVWLGPSCDRTDPACQAAAKRVAKRYAPRVHAAYRQGVVDLFASVLGDMQAKDLAATNAFLATAAGKAFADRLRLLFHPQGDERFFRQMDMALRSAAPAGSTKGMFDEFHRETAQLPRGKPLSVPAPPRPPAPVMREPQR